MKKVLILGDLPGDGADRLSGHCDVRLRDGNGLGEEELTISVTT